MGEAKRREDLGPTRKIRVSKEELADLVNYLAGPPDHEGKKIDRDARRAMRSALEQIGVLDLWRRARKGPMTKADQDLLPNGQIRELTVDAISTLLANLKDMDVRTALNLGDLEERLEDARAGTYVIDDDQTTPAVAPPG